MRGVGFRHLMFTLVLAAAGSAAWASSWSAQTRINYRYVPGTTIAGAPEVVVSPVTGRVYAAYQTMWNSYNGNDYVIGVARGIISGRTIDWSGTANAPVEASPRGHKSLSPAVTVGSRNGQEIIHVTFWDHGGTEDVLYVRSTDGGTTWSTPVNLSNTGTATSSVLASDDQGDVYAVWTDWYGNAGGNNLDLYFRKGTFDGSTTVWQATRKIESNPNTKSLYPRIFRDAAGGLHVAWADRLISPPRLMYTASADGGTTFSSPQTVFIGGVNNDMQGAAVAVDAAGTVYAAAHTPPAYGNTGPTWLYLCTKAPGGNWSAPVTVSGSDPCANPFLTADGAGHVFLSWLRYTDGQYDILVQTHGPAGWSASSNSTRDGYWKGYTGGHVVVDPANGFLHVVTDNTPDSTHQIYATTLDLRAGLSPVTSLTATGLPGQVRLSWTSPNDLSLSGVRIVYRTDRYPVSPSEAGTLTAGDVAAAAGVTGTFTHAGLTDFVTYYYAVFAHDDAGNNSTAALVTGRPPGLIPGDFDHDDDVDQSDFGHLQACLALTDSNCTNADLNGDSVVGAADITKFLTCFAGPVTYAPANCGQ